MTTDDVIQLARDHLCDNPEKEASARLCLADAMACLDKGNLRQAKYRARRSLAYSVGILHPDYQRTLD